MKEWRKQCLSYGFVLRIKLNICAEVPNITPSVGDWTPKPQKDSYGTQKCQTWLLNVWMSTLKPGYTDYMHILNLTFENYIQEFPVARWVKNLVWSVLWLRSLLWRGFDPWPRNFHILGTWPKKLYLAS